MLPEVRWSKILNTLSLHASILDKDLQERVGCTLPTLKKDIVQLNRQLKEIAKIHLQHGSYFLEVFDKEKFEKIITGGFKKNLDFNSSQKRIAFILYSLLESDSFVKIDELAEQMNISRSTINNDIKKIKKILKKYNVTIQGKPNRGMILIGDEFNLRLMMLYLILDYYDIPISFSDEVMNFIEELSESYQLNFQYQNLFYKVIRLSIDRILKGYSLGKPILLYRNYLKDHSKLNQLFTLLEKEYAISLSSLERDFLSFPINIENPNVLSEINNEEYEEEIRDIFEEMIKRIEKMYSIKMNSQLFFEKIKNHLMLLLNRLVFRFPLSDIFSNEVKASFPFAFELAKVSARLLEEKYGLQVDEIEINYLTVYFVLFLEEGNKVELSQEENIKKVAVISNIGVGAFELLKRQIKDILGGRVIVHHINEFGYKFIDLENYDLVFTLGLSILELDIPVVRISNIFDRRHIEEEIEKIQSEKDSISLQDIHRYMEISLFHLSEKDDYVTAVSHMIHELVKKGQLDGSFYQRWKDREQIQEMIFDKGIAIPHAVNKNHEKFVLSVGIYDKEIKQNNKRVKVIFLMGIPEKIDKENQKILTFTYDKIFSIGINEVLYQEMVEVQGVEEIKKFLLRKE